MKWGYLFFSGVVAGCAVHAPQPAAVAPPTRDAMAVVRAGGDPVSSLRATFDLRLERNGEVQRGRGVLLVRRPDRFRLRLSSLLGLTVLDYTSNGGSDELWLASEEKVLRGADIGTHASFSAEAVRLVFLRAEDAFGERCTEANEGTVSVVECRDGSGAVRYRGFVERDSSFLQGEVVFEGDQDQLRVTYGDHRLTAGVWLPYSIEWTDTAPATRVSIEVVKYEVNPSLSEALFAPLEAR